MRKTGKCIEKTIRSYLKALPFDYGFELISPK